MTTEKPIVYDNLAARPRLSKHIVTSCSPSSSVAHILWPNGQKQDVQMDSNPTVAQQIGTTESVMIYRRGTKPYERLHEQLAHAEQVRKERRDELERQLRAEMAAQERELLGTGSADPDEPEMPCDKDGPHVHCSICTDPSTGAPFCTTTEFSLRAHERGAAHKTQAEKVGALAEV